MIAPEAAAREAAAHFAIQGVALVSPLSGGLVHETWLITDEVGARFVFQKLNTTSLGDTESISIVTEHLAARGMMTPRVVPTTAGPLTLSADGAVWRMLTFVPGSTIEREPSVAQARSAARLLARFHAALASLESPLPAAPAHFHDTPYYLSHMQELHAGRRDERHAICEPLVEKIASILIPRLPLLADQQRRLLHGDPKISNFRFDDAGDEAICMLDLDTIGRYALITELGDMLRSCASRGPHIDETVWSAIIGAYAAEADIGPGERAAIPDGFVIYCMEVASRYIIDAYEESFFRHDRTAYATLAEQNIAKAQLQIERAEDFLRREAELRARAA